MEIHIGQLHGAGRGYPRRVDIHSRGYTGEHRANLHECPLCWPDGSGCGRAAIQAKEETQMNWLMNNRVVIGILAALVIIWKIFTLGKASEKAAQDKDSLKNLRDRSLINEKVESSTATERRANLRKWLRKK